jgi:uncharacterized lipoprotein YddW (UPF0748 family)
MTSSGGYRHFAALLATALVAACAFPLLARNPADGGEVRALWVARTNLATPQAISAMVKSARESGFNTLIVQVRGRGDAYYGGGPEPRATALSSQPTTFDPLADVLALARPANLSVHAWVNVNLIASASTLPASKSHLIRRHPEWLMVPRRLSRDLLARKPGDPAYLAALARWTRTQSSDVEGLYASPAQPAAAAHVVALAAGIAERYAVDGIHLDYARYPTEEFDYSRPTLTMFKQSVLAGMPEAERRLADARASRDLVAFADGRPEEWAAFRRERLTSLVAGVAAAVKKVRPGAIVSAAVVPDASVARSRRLQDWPAWVESGHVDVVCPMAYTVDPAAFAAQIADARERVGGGRVWAGIGAYRLSSTQTVAHIETARRLGVDGIVLFSYDSLTTPRSGVALLPEVGQAAFDR